MGGYVIDDGRKLTLDEFLVYQQERIKELEAQLAECHRLSGAEPSGVESIDAAEAVGEVRRLREEYDEIGDYEERCKELEERMDRAAELLDRFVAGLSPADLSPADQRRIRKALEKGAGRGE